MTDHLNYKYLYLSSEYYKLFGFKEMLQLHYENLFIEKTNIEIGFQFLNTLFNKLGFSFVGFLFIIALITNGLLVKFIYRYDYPVFSILILIATSS